MKKSLFVLSFLLATFVSQAQILFENGPVYNSIGTGASGANESVLMTTTFGMGTIGFGNQASAFNRIADDVVISDCYWRIDSVVFYAYQTGSTTTSTITAVNVRMWDSIPDAVGASVVFGDTLTNRLLRTDWTGVYRVTETTIGATTRPIMFNVVDFEGIIVPAGTYWFDWQSAGSLTSGPWAAPIALPDTNITGNGMQRMIGASWNNALDGGTGNPAQGFPFKIYGEAINITSNVVSEIEACEGSSVVLGGSPLATGGIGSLDFAWTPASTLNDSTLENPLASPLDTTIYYVQISDSLSCVVFDSVKVNVHIIDNSVTVTDSSLVANASGLSYQWVDCNNAYAEFFGAVDPLFEPTLTGNFAVIMNDGLCADTSDCNMIIVDGLDDYSDRVTLYPNPADDNLFISIKATASNVEYRLFDMDGRMVMSGEIQQQCNISVQGLENGVYNLQLSGDGVTSSHKLIVQ